MNGGTCDITMPATATSAIATAASADADADGFSAAYLRSCRHQYCGAGVLLLSRDRRKPQNVFAQGWAGGSSSFYRSDLTSVAIPRDRALALCLPLCLHLDTSGSLPVICRASSPTSARPGLSRGKSCSTRSLVRRMGKAGVLSAPGSPARLTPLFCPRGGACSMHAPFPPPRSLPMPLLRHSPALAPHRIPEQPFGHASGLFEFTFGRSMRLKGVLLAMVVRGRYVAVMA